MGADVEGRVRTACRQMVEQGTIPGATWAIVQGRGGDQRVRVESCGVHDDDTVFRIASVTKSIVGLLTAALVTSGELDAEAQVASWVPELGGRSVLRSPGAPLDDVVPAERALTVRDVVAMGAGIGWGEVLEGTPLQAAVAAQGLESTWLPSALTPGEWARRAGALPMAHQPGEGWLYQMSYDLLTIVLERATGMTLDALLHQRLLVPVGMTDTGWSLPADRVARVPAQFFPNRVGRPVQVAPEADPTLLAPPAFCSAAAGLLSTAPDLAALGAMLLNDGLVGETRIVPASALRLMTTDLRGPAAARMSRGMLGEHRGWGYGVGIDLEPAIAGSGAGRFGWDGGTGTTMWTDPEAGISAVMLTQSGMGGITGADYLDTFWSAVYG